MRDIKFRGKRYDNNHNNWIYGYLHVIDTLGDGYTGMAIQQQHGKSRPYSVRVHDEMIGQYTGSKDRNGRYIYEGDIIDGSYVSPLSQERIEKHYKVVYADSGFEAHMIGSHPFGSTLLRFVNGIVIGNIHENPELIEKQ